MVGIKSKKLTKSYQLDISGELTVAQSASFHKALKQVLKQKQPVTVNLNGLSGIDLTGLQLLCSMHQACIQKKKPVAIQTDQIDWLKEILRISGFSQIECPWMRNDGCFWITGGAK